MYMLCGICVTTTTRVHTDVPDASGTFNNDVYGVLMTTRVILHCERIDFFTL